MDYKMLKGKELSMGRQFWVTHGVDNPANRTLIAEDAVHQLGLPPVKRNQHRYNQNQDYWPKCVNRTYDI